MSLRARLAGWLLILLTAAAALGWQLVAAPPRNVREIVQERWTYATPPLGPNYQVGQSFTAQRDGLQAITVLAARYRPDEQLPADAQMRLVLERLDRPDRTPIVVALSIANVQNNQRLRFGFPPEADSAGGIYRLTLRSSQDYGVGVWASAAEALADGELYDNGAPVEGDLVFETHHAYPLARLLRDLPGILAPWMSMLAAALLALALPGLALFAWAPPRRPVNAALFAAWLLALGLSFWPLLLLWTTTLGLPLSAPAAWGITLALAAAAAVGLWRGWRAGRRLRLAPVGWPEATLAAILTIAVIVRLIQARAQIVPVWVDSVHHTMVAQLIVEQGLIPATGEPFISISGFHYHFGYHAGAAVVSWLANLAPYRSVLGYGQLLSGLAGLPLYALTAHLMAGRRTLPPLAARWAGVVAAAVPSFLTYMPAYYLSWGRHTQLAGLLILPVLLMATMELVEALTPANPNRGSLPPLPRAGEGARKRLLCGRTGGAEGLHTPATLLLIAGLALTHYRVLAFYAAFWGVYIAAVWAMTLWRGIARRVNSPSPLSRVRERGRSPVRPALPHAGVRAWRRILPTLRTPLVGLALAAGALVLIAPWVARMITGALLPFGTIYGRWSAPEGASTALPINLLRAEGTLWLLALAGLGWLWAIVRRRWRLALLGAWTAACALLSDLSWLGLQGTWFIHGTSAAISYWLPAGVLIGWLAGDLALAPVRWLWGRAAKRRLALGLSAALLCGLMASSVGSAWGQVDRVNESTVLLRESDLPAINWVREHLPADSLILINTRPWQEGIPMGADAGWWLPYLTGHRVTYPAVLYTHGEPGYRDPIRALAQAVETAEALDDPALLRMLAKAGVTHVFVGTRGGPLEPPRLAEPHYVELFRYGPTRVYRFAPPAD